MEDNRQIRLQKFIALAGVASRRKAEEMISDGRVRVNNKIVDKLGVKIDSEVDKVQVDGKVIKLTTKKIYIMLNKPSGYITTASDQFNRPTVMDLVKDIPHRIYPVGRLDYDTEGLLILTNDGDFANKILHPKHSIEKVYIAEVIGIPSEKSLDQLRKGLDIDGFSTSPAEIEIISIKDKSCQLEIKIHEGKNRQVRKMCEAIGHPVKKLKRISISNLALGDLPLGKWRNLKDSELKNLL